MRISDFFQTGTVPVPVLEGGNVFKDQPVTGRIQQADVIPTVKWLENITGLSLTDHMLGTTGKKSSSGDLDLAVDEATVSKDVLFTKLQNAAKKLGLPDTSVKKSGVSVHFRTPIRGTGEAGYVQTDFMFTDDLAWMRYMMSADPSSKYSGQHRAQLLASVAKAQGYKVTARGGLVDRSSNSSISKDPDEIAHMLFGAGADARSISSVENMMAALKNDANREAKIADARDTFAKSGLVLPESSNQVSQIKSLSYKGIKYHAKFSIGNFTILTSQDNKFAILVDGKKNVRWLGKWLEDEWEFTTYSKGKFGTFYINNLKDLETVFSESKLSAKGMVERKKSTDSSPGRIDADEDPCWSGYHMVGTKMKKGRAVPNCVPGKKGS